MAVQYPEVRRIKDEVTRGIGYLYSEKVLYERHVGSYEITAQDGTSEIHEYDIEIYGDPRQKAFFKFKTNRDESKGEIWREIVGKRDSMYFAKFWGWTQDKTGKRNELAFETEIADPSDFDSCSIVGGR